MEYVFFTRQAEKFIDFIHQLNWSYERANNKEIPVHFYLCDEDGNVDRSRLFTASQTCVNNCGDEDNQCFELFLKEINNGTSNTA